MSREETSVESQQCEDAHTTSLASSGWLKAALSSISSPQPGGEHVIVLQIREAQPHSADKSAFWGDVVR